MSENPVNGQSATSVGEVLKSKRQEKKLSLADVNKSTKLSVEVLKLIEQDDFGSFESEIYLKGFLRNYAKFLGLDVDYVLQLLDGQQGGGAPAAGGTMWDIEESVREEKLKSPRILTRVVVPLLIIVIIILAILLAMERSKVKKLQSNLGQLSGHTESVELRHV